MPRGRYYSLCDSSGNDDKTLANELFAYRDTRQSDEIAIIDPSYPGDREALQQYGHPTEALIFVAMRPGAGPA